MLGTLEELYRGFVSMSPKARRVSSLVGGAFVNIKDLYRVSSEVRGAGTIGFASQRRWTSGLAPAEARTQEAAAKAYREIYKLSVMSD
jgi:hypothetical protein